MKDSRDHYVPLDARLRRARGITAIVPPVVLVIMAFVAASFDFRPPSNSAPGYSERAQQPVKRMNDGGGRS